MLEGKQITVFTSRMRHHRVTVLCPVCSKELAVGRYEQHMKVHK